MSEFIRKTAVAKGFPAEKAIVHYTGIDTSVFRADPLVSRCPLVLFVGRLIPNKGCRHLIRSMASIQQLRPDVNLVIIGDGPLRSELTRQASTALKHFEFLGAQPPTVVREWMNRASVFSVPSVTVESGQSEGFGMVFAEAQAMGLPVVSFATGGIPEAVANGRTGFLVPERDWEALGEKLFLLLHDQNLWNDFSQAGTVRAEKLFNVREQGTRLERLYEEVLIAFKQAKWAR